MFGLIRWIFSFVVFAIVLWFATMVPLGSKTLWQHLKAIAGTREAQELAEGTKSEAKKVADRVRGDDAKTDAGAARMPTLPKSTTPPLDPVDKHDREGLDRLVREKTTHSP